jgi:putative ABC transport system substrate-binding protein
VYRIGFISPGSGPDALTETFRQGLREFGYVEGQNLVSEYRGTALGEPLAKLAAELVALKPDLIVSVSHRVSMEVKRATSTIPVIFAHVNDPIGVGLPASERTAGRAEWAQRGQQRAHLRARPCEPPADNAWVSRLR